MQLDFGQPFFVFFTIWKYLFIGFDSFYSMSCIPSVVLVMRWSQSQVKPFFILGLARLAGMNPHPKDSYAFMCTFFQYPDPIFDE
jgi:hypothetical protein